LPKDEYTGGRIVAGVSGCCFMIRQDLMRTLGAFSEDFDQYDSGFHASLEEADLSWRAQLLGYRIELVEDSILYHKHKWNRLHARRFASRECGRYLTVLRNYELRTILLLLPVFVYLEVMTLAFAAFKGREWVQRKIHVWGWILKNTRRIHEMRRRVQRLRVISDGPILRRMSPTISFSYTINMGPIGNVVNRMTDLLFTLYYRWLCAVVR
jgi:GT2 family glycosyltransferase